MEKSSKVQKKNKDLATNIEPKQMTTAELVERSKLFSKNAVEKLSWIDETLETIIQIKKLNNLQ